MVDGGMYGDGTIEISVVTPSYGQLGWLDRCISSVRDQVESPDLGGVAYTVSHVIQDGGTPGIEEFAAQHAARFSRDGGGGIGGVNGASAAYQLAIYAEKDGGMYDAINRGFAKSRGDILAWLNCDEQYLPDALRRVADWFHKHPDMDLLFGDVVVVAPDGSPLSYRQALRPMRGHIRSCFLPTYSAATFVRRRVFEEGHRLDTRFRAIADAVWIDQLLGAGYRAGVLNEPLSVFTQTGENLGQSEAGRAESRAWREGPGSWWRAKWWSAVHRLRKYAAGAYRRRAVTVEIFVEGTGGRVARTGRVGERWRTD